jgi:hypothetical protein
MSEVLSDRLKELELQLQSANDAFERELRARGFDPKQVETAALPTALAQLYLQREMLQEEVDELRSGKRGEDDHD